MTLAAYLTGTALAAGAITVVVYDLVRYRPRHRKARR